MGAPASLRGHLQALLDAELPKLAAHERLEVAALAKEVRWLRRRQPAEPATRHRRRWKGVGVCPLCGHRTPHSTREARSAHMRLIYMRRDSVAGAAVLHALKGTAFAPWIARATRQRERAIAKRVAAFIEEAPVFAERVGTAQVREICRPHARCGGWNYRQFRRWVQVRYGGQPARADLGGPWVRPHDPDTFRYVATGKKWTVRRGYATWLRRKAEKAAARTEALG